MNAIEVKGSNRSRLMNKTGGASVGGGGAGVGFGVGNAHAAGPTAAATAAAQLRQRTLLQRADVDIGSLLDNFSHLVKAARVNDPLRNAQESFQMEVHASRVIEKRSATFVHLNEETEQLLMCVGEEEPLCRIWSLITTTPLIERSPRKNQMTIRETVMCKEF